MIVKTFINKIVKIIYNPLQNWGNYDFFDKDFKYNFKNVFICTLLLVFIARLVGTSLYDLPNTSIWYIIIYSILCFFVDLICFLSIILSIKKIIPFYNTIIKSTDLLMIIFISLIPFYLSVIIYSLFPGLYFLSVITLYGFYILYCGMLRYINIPKKDMKVLFIIISMIIIGFYLVLYFILLYPFFNCI